MDASGPIRVSNLVTPYSLEANSPADWVAGVRHDLGIFFQVRSSQRDSWTSAGVRSGNLSHGRCPWTLLRPLLSAMVAVGVRGHGACRAIRFLFTALVFQEIGYGGDARFDWGAHLLRSFL